ncbi:MAG: hypothetical protein HY587_07465 [Candidatus Omnitrophica bacterium]|nr:hypothetical protein [Candidatus Omnitrophota bacterium]
MARDEEAQKRESPSALSYETVKQIIGASENYPVDRCLVNGNWKKTGLARIVVTRRQEDGNFIAGVYLADIFCLGVKNAFSNAGLSKKTVEEELLPGCFTDGPHEEITIGFAKEIIFGAVDYAKKLGFDPHPDFKLARKVLGDEQTTNHHHIRFGGPDGKPLYIQGPDDDADEILEKLSRNPVLRWFANR